jgi:hypothetical protein
MTDMPLPSKPGKWAQAFSLLVITLWVGSLWGVGFLAVPVLFQSLPDKMLAGMLAGKMFTLVSWVGMGSACYLIFFQTARSGMAALRHPVLLTAACMLLLTLVGEFILQPEMAALKALAQPTDVMHSPFAERFEVLHKAAAALYLAESLLGIVLVLKEKHG